MIEDQETEHPSPENKSASRPVRRVTFDDFEIERGAGSDDSVTRSGFLKNAIPRIRSMKDDLIGGSGKISTKIFGGKHETESAEHPEHPWNEPAAPIDPLSAPYFSDEERSLIRVKKIPK